MAELLAQGVRLQWEAETRVRRLNDPFPLSVEWVAADTDLVESWSHLEELARDWPGQPPANSIWAADAEGLAGQGGEIAQVFDRIPTRRLVVLGEPGAGKSMLLIRLLLDLLERRPSGGPVPVLFPLASWDPTRQDLHTWMADQIVRDHHSALHAADPLQRSPGTLARALLEWRLIVPILDGLDELPEAVRALALHTINQALPTGQPLVLSSRTAEYRSALTPSAGATVLLNGAAGIRLRPLDAVKAAAYLKRDAGGANTRAAARWRGVTASLGTGTPVSQALSTPLGLFLARTIYNPRPGEHIADLAHPDELLDQARFPTREDIDTHLFAAFIPAAYRPHPRWTVQRAQHTFTFLAQHLDRLRAPDDRPRIRDLAWWQLGTTMSRSSRMVVVGLVTGLAFGLISCLVEGLISIRGGLGLTLGLMNGLVNGILDGVLTGLAFGLAHGVGPRFVGGAFLQPSRRRIQIRDRTRQPRPRIIPRLLAGVGLGLASGVMIGLGSGLVNALVRADVLWLMVGLVNAVIWGLVLGVGTGLALGFTAWLETPINTEEATSPTGLLNTNRASVLFQALVLGPAFGLVAGLGSWLVIELLPGHLWGIPLQWSLTAGLRFGFLGGLGGGLGVVLSLTAWGQWLVLARIWLPLTRRLPWAVSAFLQDAHQRGVLRQNGAFYQFRHALLQEHLTSAVQTAPPTRGDS